MTKGKIREQNLPHFYKTDARILGRGEKLIFLLSGESAGGDSFNFFKGRKKSIACRKSG